MAADVAGYKALVCVFLEGGMDNYDTILPFDELSYSRYAEIRQSLLRGYGRTRARENLLELLPDNSAPLGSRRFAVPPELAPVHALFQKGAAAIVANVGPLLEPITRIDFDTNKHRLPLRLFSHNDQQATWLSLMPEGGQSGWGGRFADAQIASGANSNPEFSAISLFGNSIFVSGTIARPFQISPDGVPSILVLSQFGFDHLLSEVGYGLLGEHFYSQNVKGAASLLERDLVEKRRRALQRNELFRTSAMNVPNLTTRFPSSDLAQQLYGIARTIAVHDDLGVARQIFFCGMRGFDTHSGQATTLPMLQAELAQAIAAFYDAMQELGTAPDVTLFTASDFGRTLAVNGDGTDHGWGSHHFVVGDSVIGRRIYGELPPIDFDHDYDAGGGRLIPTASLQQYAATLGRWFGLTQAELEMALPGLGRFPAGDLLFV